MRILVSVIPVVLLGGCAITPSPITSAPQDQAKAVVFDIDGTLTPHIWQTWKSRDDAAKAVHYFADRDYKVIYLSARTRFWQKPIPRFLTKNGFPEGNIQVPETGEDRKDKAQFKEHKLKAFEQNHWFIEYAFGDRATDSEAYTKAEISHIIGLKRRGSKSCDRGLQEHCFGTWAEYLNSNLKPK